MAPMNRREDGEDAPYIPVLRARNGDKQMTLPILPDGAAGANQLAQVTLTPARLTSRATGTA